MTGRVDILWRIFEKIAKKKKIMPQGPKKHNFSTFSQKFDNNYAFIEILCSLNFFVDIHLDDVLKALLVVGLFTKLLDERYVLEDSLKTLG